MYIYDLFIFEVSIISNDTDSKFPNVMPLYLNLGYDLFLNTFLYI